ncbi:MAG: MauE/DoxX family redox-associated membrane protein [Thermodesulfobacteriota bacterium]
MKILKSALTYKIFKYFISAVFIYSGITKLFGLNDFAVIISAYGLIPESLNYAAAFFLSAAEVFAGILLIFDIKGGLSGITVMLIIFIFVLIYGIHLGLNADCGCFGADDPEGKAFSGLKAALIKDFIFLGIITYLYWWRYKNNKVLNFN